MALAAEQTAAIQAFLGVERSLGGKRWRQRSGDDRMGLAISQRLSLPEVVGRILAARGLEPDAVERGRRTRPALQLRRRIVGKREHRARKPLIQNLRLHHRLQLLPLHRRRRLHMKGSLPNKNRAGHKSVYRRVKVERAA